MVNDIKLVPGLIIEGFNSDYTVIEQFKLVYFDESYKEYNPCTNQYEPLWEVSGHNGSLTRYYFESEIQQNFWIDGQNNNIAYDYWTIIKA